MAANVAYQAYTVVKREGADDFWLNIGAAFMHQDGDGYNIVLQALPINGKIVLRLPKTQGDEVHETGPQRVEGSSTTKAPRQRRS
jgi:hypothetical protein